MQSERKGGMLMLGELETWRYVAWGCQGEVGKCDVSRRSSVTRVLSSIHFAFSAVIKEMFMLRMMQRRGQRRAQPSTLRHTTPSTIALHPSTITILLASSSLVSPSFFRPPFSSLARCIFGSESQFCTAPHSSTASE